MSFPTIWVSSLDNSIELALANLDLNDPVLEPVTFDDSDPLEGSSSTQQILILSWLRRRRRRALMSLLIQAWRRTRRTIDR